MVNPVQHETNLELSSDQATTVDTLSAWVADARSRSLQLIGSLDEASLEVPKLPTVNPMLWEIGHAAWFQENWVLRHAAGQPPILPDGESLYDSIAIDHHTRWDLPVPSRQEMFDYVKQVRDAVLELLQTNTLTSDLSYFVKLSVFHEDMHTEAFTYTRQTLGLPQPAFNETNSVGSPQTKSFVDAIEGDAEFAGGEFELGSARDTSFVFDNEKWAHPVFVEPFALARAAVSQLQFAQFVDDAGYQRRELWSDEGWYWRQNKNAEHPVYWRREAEGWTHRHFAEFLPLSNRAMIHVNWFEAEAYCRWANRRLPTEAEWEFAATRFDNADAKRHYPWGGFPPIPDRVNMDWQAMGPVDVSAHPEGESHAGCRQMLGNVWEWTATTFEPYPGFSVDPYEAYSQPAFGNCKVLRGGCWATRSRLIRNTWRNYFPAHRRDVFGGFRTCPIS